VKHLVPLRLFESQSPSSGLTPVQEKFINDWRSSGIWNVNPTTGLVDIQGDFAFKIYIITTQIPTKSFLGIEFGNVTGKFKCTHNQLQSLEGAPREVGGHFWCYVNNLKSLKGGPHKVGGDFDCTHNELQSLEGAPQEINGEFRCDAFTLSKGEWNVGGFMDVLQKGSQKAKELILTLPNWQPDWWNLELQRHPGKTVHLLAQWWKHLAEDTKAKIKIPPGYENEFDFFSGFDELGLF
jgi:hypothetical protein